MKIDYKSYIVDTSKNVNIKIAHISDIHFSKEFKIKRLELVRERLYDVCPNYICITGDLIDTYNDISESNFSFFVKWLTDLSSICKVIISIGNHEYIRRINNSYDVSGNISWLKELDIKNVIVLDNDIYNDGSVTFVGFNPSIQYYSNYETKVLKEDNLKLFKLASKLNNSFNVLLEHTPFYIYGEENFKRIKDFDKFDLVLCGHTHGGMIPSIIPGSFGIISPSKRFFPKNVRGRKLLDTTTVIISSGITKLSRKSKLTFLTDIYGANINEIIIKNKKNNK